MTNLLTLEAWRALMGWHPWHFWGLSDPIYTPVPRACSDLAFRYAWQGTEASGREDIREAIYRAEEKLRDYLLFAPAPHYVEEVIQYPEFHMPTRLWLSRSSITGRWPLVTLREGFIQALGVESLTLIGNANLTYSDADGDGLNDTFTASIATTQTDPLKIAAYFTAADRWDGSDVGPDWRIDPIRVTISGGIATVTGKRWLVVKPVKYETQGQEVPLDPTDNANFATQLAIYVRTTDPTGTTAATSQLKFTWSSLPYADFWHSYCCNTTDTSNTDPAAIAEAAGRGSVYNYHAGIVTVGSSAYNMTSGTWSGVDWSACRAPDSLTVRYLAGYPLENGKMAKRYAQIIAMLAAAELPAPACGDGSQFQRLFHYQYDLSRAGGNIVEQYSISQEDLNNPFGTRRGQVLAWKQVRRDIETVGRGVTA